MRTTGKYQTVQSLNIVQIKSTLRRYNSLINATDYSKEKNNISECPLSSPHSTTAAVRVPPGRESTLSFCSEGRDTEERGFGFFDMEPHSWTA